MDETHIIPCQMDADTYARLRRGAEAAGEPEPEYLVRMLNAGMDHDPAAPDTIRLPPETVRELQELGGPLGASGAATMYVTRGMALDRCLAETLIATSHAYKNVPPPPAAEPPAPVQVPPAGPPAEEPPVEPIGPPPDTPEPEPPAPESPDARAQAVVNKVLQRMRGGQ